MISTLVLMSILGMLTCCVAWVECIPKSSHCRGIPYIPELGLGLCTSLGVCICVVWEVVFGGCS